MKRRLYKRDDAVRTKRGRYGIIAGNMGLGVLGEWSYGVRWDTKPEDIDRVIETDLIPVGHTAERINKDRAALRAKQYTKTRAAM